jgi:GNAT superfamily N-acetyltransferase
VPDEHLAKLSYERRVRMFEAMLDEPVSGQFTLVGEDEAGQIVAVASGGPERSGDSGFQGELYGIYIVERYQRRGLGRRLTRAVAERLAQAGMASMLVWVLAENPACRFYEALGGKLVGTKPREIGGKVLEVVAYGWPDLQDVG